MWLAALRRLALLIVACVALSALAGLILGPLLGASFDRGFALALYLLGAFLMIAGFFVGNLGPARVRSESPSAGFTPFPLFGARRLRWATLGEQHEAINQSALFIGLGFILVVIGVFVDTRYSLL